MTSSPPPIVAKSDEAAVLSLQTAPSEVHEEHSDRTGPAENFLLADSQGRLGDRLKPAPEPQFLEVTPLLVAGLPVQKAPAQELDGAIALRLSLGLAPTASEHELSERIVADNARILRKSLGLPNDATEQQVSDRIAQDNAEAAIRKLV